jgi:hypothetical protein
MKPISLDNLARTVRRVLDQAGVDRQRPYLPAAIFA